MQSFVDAGRNTLYQQWLFSTAWWVVSTRTSKFGRLRGGMDLQIGAVDVRLSLSLRISQCALLLLGLCM